MIFGKTKKDGEEVAGRPLESAAINRWRSINSSGSNTLEENSQEEITTSDSSLNDQNTEQPHLDPALEEIQIISLDQVFEEDEEKVVRLPEERDDLDIEEPLFNYQAQSVNSYDLDENYGESYEDDVDSLLEKLEEKTEEEEEEDVQVEEAPLQASIEIEETRVTKKAPSRPPLEKANFDIASEQDLKNRFGDNIQSALGAGTMIEGRFSFEAPVRIDGSLKGEIKSSSALIVGKNAVVSANIKVGALIILGSVEGEIEAEDLIEIRSSGTLLGDVVTKRIALEEGGVFSGSCTMVD